MVTDSENFSVIEGPEPQPCPPNARRMGDVCVCNPGYHNEGGVCVPDQPGEQELVVTPQNYLDMLTNYSSASFAGSTNEYVQVTSSHAMLALPCEFMNVDMECEVYIVRNTGNYALQLQSRTYRHPGDSPGNGAAYKARYRNTSSTHVKEVVHTNSPNGYAGNRANGVISYPTLIGRWTTLRFRTMNLSPAGGIIPVRLEAYVNGQLMSNYEDRGGWCCDNYHFQDGRNSSRLPRRQLGSDGRLLSGFRTPCEIINTPLRWVIWRSDGDCVWRFRRLVARNLGPNPTVLGSGSIFDRFSNL